MPYIQEGPGGDPEFEHSPVGRMLGYGTHRAESIKRCVCRFGVMLVRATNSFRLLTASPRVKLISRSP